MAGMFKAAAIGNLGSDPETRHVDSGTVCSFSLACNVGSKDKPHTEWVRVSCWGALADVAGRYLAKGRSCYVEGRLTSRSYEGKDGSQRFSLELSATQLVLLGGSERQTEPADDLDTIPFS